MPKKVARRVAARWMEDNEARHCCNPRCRGSGGSMDASATQGPPNGHHAQQQAAAAATLGTQQATGPFHPQRFGIVSNRRHHCRECGKIFCDRCAPAPPTGNAEDRKCIPCSVPQCFVPVLLPERRPPALPGSFTGVPSSKGSPRSGQRSARGSNRGTPPIATDILPGRDDDGSCTNASSYARLSSVCGSAEPAGGHGLRHPEGRSANEPSPAPAPHAVSTSETDPSPSPDHGRGHPGQADVHGGPSTLSDRGGACTGTAGSDGTASQYGFDSFVDSIKKNRTPGGGGDGGVLSLKSILSSSNGAPTSPSSLPVTVTSPTGNGKVPALGGHFKKGLDPRLVQAARQVYGRWLSSGPYVATALPMQLILSFLEFRPANALMQTCSSIMSQFPLHDMPFVESVFDVYPNLRGTKPEGKGNGGTVYMVEDRARLCFTCVKVINKVEVPGLSIWRRLQTEIDIQRRMNHPNIARLYQTFQSPTHAALAVQAGEGKTLRKAFDLIRVRPADIEVFALNCIKQVTLALQYMYDAHHVVHRDIKAENIVLNRNFSTVLVIDFGLAEYAHEDNSPQEWTPCGTKGFASPENVAAVVQRKTKFRAPGSALHSADIFSLAIVAFMILSSARPFRSQHFSEMHTDMVRGIRCEGPRWDRISTETKRLLEWMLQYDHQRRATALDILAHPALSGIDERYANISRQREEVVRSQDQDMQSKFDIIDIDEVLRAEEQIDVRRGNSPRHKALL